MDRLEEEQPLEKYFEKIGFNGKREADLETLKQLTFLHPQAIPYENLDAYLGIPVNLDLPTLQEKLIYHRRGGIVLNRIFCSNGCWSPPVLR